MHTAYGAMWESSPHTATPFCFSTRQNFLIRASTFRRSGFRSAQRSRKTPSAPLTACSACSTTACPMAGGCFCWTGHYEKKAHRSMPACPCSALPWWVPTAWARWSTPRQRNSQKKPFLWRNWMPWQRNRYGFCAMRLWMRGNWTSLFSSTAHPQGPDPKFW